MPQNDEKALKKAVANQPVSVAIEAGGREFQLYQTVMVLSKSIFVFSFSFEQCKCIYFSIGFWKNL